MTFRIARHTDNINQIAEFYTKILLFDVLGTFNNHQNYSGVFFGFQNTDWHFEFTESNTKANHKFDEDDLLVFYPKSKSYQKIIQNIEQYKIKTYQAKNPYWNDNGILIKDPDGYHIVISNTKN